MQFFVQLHGGRGANADTSHGQWPGEYEAQDAQYSDAFELVTSTFGREGQTMDYEPYAFGPRVRQIVEDELLDNVAFAIARLDSDSSRDPADSSMADMSTTKDSSQMSADSSSDDVGSGARAGVGVGHQQGSETGATSPRRLSGRGQEAEEADTSWDADMQDESQMLDTWKSTGSPFDSSSPILSTSYENRELDEEAAVGRMACLSLLAAISSEECVDSEVLTSRFVPEVMRMKADAAFFVRKEAAVAIASLAKGIPTDAVVQQLVSGLSCVGSMRS